MTTASNLSEAVKSNFLDLDGGVMNGTISMDEIVSMKRSSNESYMQINGGSSWGNGASLELFGKDHTSKGKFSLWAHNGTNYSIMEGFPDGYLTWNNKQVVCVESWSNGTSWYRKYSDGYIEQAGVYSNTTTSGTITFPTAFGNTNYSISVTQRGINSTDTGGWGMGIALNSAKTTTTCTYSVQEKCDIPWYACGY